MIGRSNVPYIEFVLLFRVSRIMFIFENLVETLNLRVNFAAVIDLVSLLATFLFASHLIACVWHFIAVQEHLSSDSIFTWVDKAQLETDWVSRYRQIDRYIMFINLVLIIRRVSEWKMNKIKYNLLYITSFYWACITTLTIGYGDITPVTQIEKLFVIFVTLLSSIIFGYTISSIGGIFNQMSENKNYLRDKMTMIDSFIKRRGLNKDLQIKVKKFFEYYLKTLKNTDSECERLMEHLSGTLIREVKIDFYKTLFDQSKLFRQNFSDEFIANLCLLVKEQSFVPEEVIFQEGQQARLKPIQEIINQQRFIKEDKLQMKKGLFLKIVLNLLREQQSSLNWLMLLLMKFYHYQNKIKQTQKNIIELNTKFSLVEESNLVDVNFVIKIIVLQNAPLFFILLTAQHFLKRRQTMINRRDSFFSDRMLKNFKQIKHYQIQDIYNEICQTMVKLKNMIVIIIRIIYILIYRYIKFNQLIILPDSEFFIVNRVDEMNFVGDGQSLSDDPESINSPDNSGDQFKHQISSQSQKANTMKHSIQKIASRFQQEPNISQMRIKITRGTKKQTINVSNSKIVNEFEDLKDTNQDSKLNISRQNSKQVQETPPPSNRYIQLEPSQIKLIELEIVREIFQKHEFQIDSQQEFEFYDVQFNLENIIKDLFTIKRKKMLFQINRKRQKKHLYCVPNKRLASQNNINSSVYNVDN